MKNKIFLPFLLAVLTLALGATSAAQGPNGTDVRPFYVMAHNPNALQDLKQAVRCDTPSDPCANAIEPDIIVLPTNPPPVDVNGNPDPAGLVVYHDYVVLTSRVPMTLPQYLSEVHDLALTHPQLALILLDIKDSAATPAYVKEIYDDVHQYLNVGGVQLNVIYNVAETSQIGAFSQIIPLLGDREGVQCDDENNAELAMNDFFAAFYAQGLTDGNIGWGDGTLGPAPNLPKAVDRASFLRASWGYPKVISDVFTIEFESSMSFFIDAGADGIIPDFPDALHPEYDSVGTQHYIENLQDVVKQHPELRLATRDDNPFQPKNQAYGLEVTTLNTKDGGTDAPLDFTLEGCLGTSTVTVHTGIGPAGLGTGRMEAGQTDHVTIPSLNLGKLTKLHVHDQGGLFNAPNWDLGTVAVSSANYIGPDMLRNIEYEATWNKTIAADATVDIPLKASFPEPGTTISCPGNMTVNNTPGMCNAIVTYSTSAAGQCNDVSLSSAPASGTSFIVGMTDVTATAISPTTGNASCSFKVTVKDVEAPVIACPGAQVVNATGPQGAVVTFAPSVADNCSVSSVTSAPVSGSVFAIGNTTVNSSAQDPSGNQSSCSFNVHVKGAAEQITDLIAYVNGITVDPTNKNALIVKLQQALNNLSGGQGGTACNDLNSFINQVSGISGKSITLSEGHYLITQATQIEVVLGCK